MKASQTFSEQIVKTSVGRGIFIFFVSSTVMAAGKGSSFFHSLYLLQTSTVHIYSLLKKWVYRCRTTWSEFWQRRIPWLFTKSSAKGSKKDI